MKKMTIWTSLFFLSISRITAESQPFSDILNPSKDHSLSQEGKTTLTDSQGNTLLEASPEEDSVLKDPKILELISGLDSSSGYVNLCNYLQKHEDRLSPLREALLVMAREYAEKLHAVEEAQVQLKKLRIFGKGSILLGGLVSGLVLGYTRMSSSKTVGVKDLGKVLVILTFAGIAAGGARVELKDVPSQKEKLDALKDILKNSQGDLTALVKFMESFSKYSNKSHPLAGANCKDFGDFLEREKKGVGAPGETHDI